MEIHEVTLNEDKAKSSPTHGVNRVSYVNDPAIKVKGFYFSNNEEEQEKVLTKEQQEQILTHLQDKGYSVDEYEKYTEISEEEYFKGQKLDPDNFAEISTSSILDRKAPNGEGVYALRYEYMGPLDDKNRSFCSRLLLARKMYTYEDINTELSNPEFNNYSIFDYKGSYGCRHTWERRYFFIDDVGVTRRVGANATSAAIASTIDSKARTLNAKLSTQYKMRVAAPALIPEKKIYRKDEAGNEYYVNFSREEIEKLVSNFQSKDIKSRFNTNHEDNVAPAYILESWIVESEEDKAYSVYGFSAQEIPIGSYMIVSQITDEKFFLDEIIEKKQYGYSVEGLFDLELILNNMEEVKEEVQKFELDGKFYTQENGKLVLFEEEKEEEEEVKAETEEVKAEEKEEEVKAETDEKEEEVEEKEEVKAEEEEKSDNYSKEELDNRFEAMTEMIAKLEAKLQDSKEEKEEKMASQEVKEPLTMSEKFSAWASLKRN